MGLKGAAIGGVAGWFFGGPLGSLLGSMLGNWIESKVDDGKCRQSGSRSASVGSGANKSLVFCGSAAAMLAKLAKADGSVSRGEIQAIEKAFDRLGFSSAAREYAIRVFRKAKDDHHSIYEYSYNFASAVSSIEVRELFYELLWDVACADGTIGSVEIEILRQIPLSLGIRPAWFEIFARERIRGYASGRGQSRRSPSPSSRDSLAEAYELLGANPSDDAETIKKRYRDLAKKYHPDALRAQGLPDEMVGKANERMSKINSAWSTIKASRGL